MLVSEKPMHWTASTVSVSVSQHKPATPQPGWKEILPSRPLGNARPDSIWKSQPITQTTRLPRATCGSEQATDWRAKLLGLVHRATTPADLDEFDGMRSDRWEAGDIDADAANEISEAIAKKRGTLN